MVVNPFITLPSGGAVPLMVYGTAWKKDRTEGLVTLALQTGFRGFDTANHPIHYDERLVGQSISKAIEMGMDRNSLWIQTKFSPTVNVNSKVHLATVDPPLEEQIHESIRQSLVNLQTHIDILFLHAPFETGVENLRAWRVFESYVPHQIKHLGVSNVTAKFIRGLYQHVSIKPEIIQNRFWAQNKFDAELRTFAAAKGIVYQAYGMLRSCGDVLESSVVRDLSAKLETETGPALYLLILRLGNVSILNGTCKPMHMEEDLRLVERIVEEHELEGELQGYSLQFDELLNSLSLDK